MGRPTLLQNQSVNIGMLSSFRDGITNDHSVGSGVAEFSAASRRPSCCRNFLSALLWSSTLESPLRSVCPVVQCPWVREPLMGYEPEGHKALRRPAVQPACWVEVHHLVIVILQASRGTSFR